METDLSRSCADLKGVGGWVGGGEVVENSNFLLLGPPYGKHKYPSPERKKSRSAHDCVYFFPTMMQCMANVPQILYMHPNSNGSLH